MTRYSSITPVVSIVSLGFGAWIGAKCQRLSGLTPKNDNCVIEASSTTRTTSQSLDTNGSTKQPWINHPLNYFIPSVNAANRLNEPMDISSGVTAQDSTSLNNNVSQLGLPGLANLRSRSDYLMSYDRRNRVPHWVLERLTEANIHHSNVDRSLSNFMEDISVHKYFRSTNDDYKHSGYDRGHMAAAGNHRLHQKSCDETFLLSNMAPQVGAGFNRDAWNDLEGYVRHLVRKYKSIYVCTGPLYLPRKENDGKVYVKFQVIGHNNVAVPTHFFKVIACEKSNGQFDLLSFVMPNQVLPEKVNLLSYLVPVNSIERSSGLLFFDKLPRHLLKSVNGRNV